MEKWREYFLELMAGDDLGKTLPEDLHIENKYIPDHARVENGKCRKYREG